MKTCNPGNTASPRLDSAQCFGEGAFRSSEEADNCRAPREVDEDVGLIDLQATDRSGTRGGVLDALPGCNPIQPGPERATKQTCSGSTSALVKNEAPQNPLAPAKATSVATTVKPATSETASPAAPVAKASPSESSTSDDTASEVELPAGWTSSGCFSDNVNPRSLGTRGEWWGEPITSSGCAAHCEKIGKSIAGTENGGQCFCGDELKNSEPLGDGCNQPCDGDQNEICGGSKALSIFRKTGAKLKTRAHRFHRPAHRFAITS